MFGFFSKNKEASGEPGVSLTQKELGERGEREAERALRKKGYKILERNFRTRFGEIDLVASQGRGKEKTLVFVEVKTRSSQAFGLGKDAVDSRKQKHLIKAAQLYLLGEGKKQKNSLDQKVRFDVFSIELKDSEFQIEHIENAFEG